MINGGSLQFLSCLLAWMWVNINAKIPVRITANIIHPPIYRTNISKLLLNNCNSTLNAIAYKTTSWFPYSTLVFSQLPKCLDLAMENGKAFYIS